LPTSPRGSPIVGRLLVATGLALAAVAWIVSPAPAVMPAQPDRRAAPPADPHMPTAPLQVGRAGGVVTVAAAGDIACDPTNQLFNGGRGTATWCRAADTRALLQKIDPDVVLPLGDTQYDDGLRWKFRKSYDRSWGRLKSRSRPVVGNHEYWVSSKATGYFSYFGARAGKAGKGWYSYNLGAWHLIALNSNCTIVGCRRGSAQYRWLKRDLRADTSRCTLAYFHHPRFSSGPHGDDPSVGPFWKLLYRDGAEIILVAHDHIYERFASLRPNGSKDPRTGIRQFTAGTGGAELYWIEHRHHFSKTRNAHTFGVLRFRLRPGSYEWRFVPVAGSSYTDDGEGSCHGRPF
jgi:hypothetical protein